MESSLSRITREYGDRYSIDGECGFLNGMEVNACYIPSIDTIIDYMADYQNPKEVVGSAMFKLDSDYCIFLTDTRDRNLMEVYEKNKKEADLLSDKLWKINTEDYDCGSCSATAATLSMAFFVVFKQTYREWRMSLANKDK